jgi:hypothetical protein
MKFYVVLVVLFSVFSVLSQTVMNEINTESYTNFANSYNYTYWNDNWKSTTTQNRSFTNQTSDYALNVDYTDLSIKNLVLTDTANTASRGFSALNSAVFTANYSGNIDYSILQNGLTAFEKTASPTNSGNKDSQMAEYGAWCTRRFVSTNFTNSAPVANYFSGVEFTNWHNRFKITFHIKPTAIFVNGQLKLSVEIPPEYAAYYNTGSLHAFGVDVNKGFVITSGQYAESINVVGNVVTVLTTAKDLLVDKSYEVSILFHAMKENLATNYTTIFDAESEIIITANQTLPAILDISNSVSYSETEGLHTIDIPRYGMGQYNCSLADEMQAIDFSLTNAEAKTKRVRLCIRQIPNVNVTGFNSVICNRNGDPSGLPIQVSKNWHNTTVQLYSGNWIKEYVEFIIPANTTLNLQYKRTGAKWGETYTASSHQLSVVGAGIPRGGWLEASLGGFGESITHSPDYEYGNTNGADVRPFLVTNENYGGTSTECNWTGNVGGLNMWVYKDNTNTVQYQSEVKTQFKRYSPNLSETVVGAVSADKKLKLDYTFYLNRSDDYLRVYYKVNVEALENTSFNRFDIFQLGGDIYNIHNAQKLIYGNDSGVAGEFTPKNDGSNAYTTAEIALTGSNPWVWAGDGLAFAGASSGIDIDANNGLIIREYKATINGVENNTPYFRERSSSQGFSASHGTNPTSYCIVPPPGTTSFTAGDKIELLVEVVILPKMQGDYYGPNENFDAALALYGNSHELLYRESFGNKITAESPTNTINTSYPLTVETNENNGLVTVTGGKGYIPLVFSGLTSVTNPTLWKASTNCWEQVDQSVHGKDFWQTNFNPETNTFDLVYNVNQDMANDEVAKIQYYLGDTPPEPKLVIHSKVGTKPSTSEANVVAVSGGDDVVLDPQINEYGSSSNAIDSNYVWTGPNNFTYTGRVLNFNPVDSTDQGDYHVTYTSESGCSDSKTYTITTHGTVSINSLERENFSFSPNPVDHNFTISEVSYKTIIYTISGQKVKTYTKKDTVFNVESLPSGVYIVHFELENNSELVMKFLKK